MTLSATWSLISLLTGVIGTLVLLLLSKLRQESKTMGLLTELLRESNQTNRSLTHLVVSRDFQTYAGLQSLTMATQSQNQLNADGSLRTTPWPNSTSEYIPRDDITEAQRLKDFGAAQGYGETIFDEETTDDELKQTIIEMVANGQIDFGEEGLH